MSLGRELSLHAGAALRSDYGGVARSWRKHETIARPEREALTAGENEIDRAAGAVQDFRVTVVVLGVGIARCVRPAVDIGRFAPERGLDRARIGRRKTGVRAVIGAHR